MVQNKLNGMKQQIEQYYGFYGSDHVGCVVQWWLWRKQLSVDFKSEDDIPSINYGFGDGYDGYIIEDDRIVMVTKDKWWQLIIEEERKYIFLFH